MISHSMFVFLLCLRQAMSERSYKSILTVCRTRSPNRHHTLTLSFFRRKPIPPSQHPIPPSSHVQCVVAEPQHTQQPNKHLFAFLIINIYLCIVIHLQTNEYMKKLLYFLLASVLATGCLSKAAEEIRIAAERKQAIKDSIISLLPEFYSLEKDSFKRGDYVYVMPLNKPKSIYQDALWAYFVLEDGNATMFRLVIQSSKNKSVPGAFVFTFNIDGKVCEIITQDYMIHESLNGSYYDIPSAYAIQFLDSLQSNSVVKMKSSNLQTYTIKEIPVEEIRDVVKVYKDYRDLGGKLEAPDIEKKNKF